MDLFGKVRVAILGRAHELLDRHVSTPEGVAQMIRDLEEAISNLADSVAEAAGNVTGLSRRISEAERAQAELETNADLLMTDDNPDNDDSALELQAQALDKETELEGLRAELEAAKQLHANLDEAMDKLSAKHREMLTALRTIRVQDAGAKAKTRAVEAIEAAGGALDSVDGGSVDNVAAAIQQRADKADARLGAAMGRLSSGGSDDVAKDLRLARAKAALMERQQRVTASALSQAAEPAPAGSQTS